jgi:hypothetical protein
MGGGKSGFAKRLWRSMSSGPRAEIRIPQNGSRMIAASTGRTPDEIYAKWSVAESREIATKTELEIFIPLDPSGVFELIAQSVKSSEQDGYSNESIAADLIVRIVQRYLADYRAVFSDRARLDDLMDCLDVFVRAGWPAAQSVTFKLGEIWR